MGGGVLAKSKCPKLIMSKYAFGGGGVRKFWTMSKILQFFYLDGPPEENSNDHHPNGSGITRELMALLYSIKIHCGGL